MMEYNTIRYVILVYALYYSKFQLFPMLIIKFTIIDILWALSPVNQALKFILNSTDHEIYNAHKW